MMTMTAQLTNHDKLMAELSEMSANALYRAFANNRITRAIDDAMCVDCKAKHGRCISTDDHMPCPFTLDDWMDQPAQPARILPAT